MLRFMLHLLVAALALPAFSCPGYAKDQRFHCLDGKKKPKHSYRELDLRFEGAKLQELSYQSEEGPSLGGDFFGCTAAAVRGESGLSWSEQANTTKVMFLESLGAASDKANSVIYNGDSKVTVTFGGNAMYFCGMQATLPEKIVLDKKSNTCKFE